MSLANIWNGIKTAVAGNNDAAANNGSQNQVNVNNAPAVATAPNPVAANAARPQETAQMHQALPQAPVEAPVAPAKIELPKEVQNQLKLLDSLKGLLNSATDVLPKILIGPLTELGILPQPTATVQQQMPVQQAPVAPSQNPAQSTSDEDAQAEAMAAQMMQSIFGGGGQAGEQGTNPLAGMLEPAPVTNNQAATNQNLTVAP